MIQKCRALVWARCGCIVSHRNKLNTLVDAVPPIPPSQHEPQEFAVPPPPPPEKCPPPPPPPEPSSFLPSVASLPPPPALYPPGPPWAGKTVLQKTLRPAAFFVISYTNCTFDVQQTSVPRLMFYFNTNKPPSFFFLQNTSCIRKP